MRSLLMFIWCDEFDCHARLEFLPDASNVVIMDRFEIAGWVHNRDDGTDWCRDHRPR